TAYEIFTLPEFRRVLFRSTFSESPMPSTHRESKLLCDRCALAHCTSFSWHRLVPRVVSNVVVFSYVFVDRRKVACMDLPIQTTFAYGVRCRQRAFSYHSLTPCADQFHFHSPIFLRTGLQ